MVQILVIGRFLSAVGGSKLIFYWQGLLLFQGFMLQGGARGEYLILKTSWWMNIILEMLVQCDTNIDLYYMVQ